MKKIIIILLTVLTTYALGATMTTQPATPKKFPIYKLDITTFGCGYDFRINDISVQYNLYDGGNVVEIPVNDLMISGKNTISMYLYPSENANELAKHGQKCTAEVSLNLTYPALDISHTLASMSYQAPANQLKAEMSDTNTNQDAYTIDSNNDYKQSSNSGNIKVSKTHISSTKIADDIAIKVTRTIDIPNAGLPTWGWEHSDIIKDDAASEASLRKYYSFIMQQLTEKKFTNLKGIFNERDKELSQAYPSNEPNHGTLNEIIADAKNPKLSLLSFEHGDGDFYVYAHGKLATIQDWDSTPVVVFNHKDQSGSENYPIMFRRQNGKWIIAR